MKTVIFDTPINYGLKILDPNSITVTVYLIYQLRYYAVLPVYYLYVICNNHNIYHTYITNSYTDCYYITDRGK